MPSRSSLNPALAHSHAALLHFLQCAVRCWSVSRLFPIKSVYPVSSRNDAVCFVKDGAQWIKDKRLIWVDMEMTGLDPDSDRVIEIATIVTSLDLDVLAEGPVIAIHQSDDVLAQNG